MARILAFTGGMTRPYQRINPGGRMVAMHGYPSKLKIQPAPLVPAVAGGGGLGPQPMKPGFMAWSQVDKGDVIQIGSYQYKVLGAHLTANQATAAQKAAQAAWAQAGRNAQATKITTPLATATGGSGGTGTTAASTAPSGPQATALGGKNLPSTSISVSYLKEIGTGNLYVVTLPLSLQVRVIKA